jgi:phosphoglycerol transferase
MTLFHKFFGRRDSCSVKRGDASPIALLPIALLVATTTLAWCAAHGKWTASAWGLPTTYLDPVYSDFLGGSAMVRAVAEGDFPPFMWKASAKFGAPYGAQWTDALSADEPIMAFFALMVRFFGLFPGFNLGVLFGHIAAGFTFYAVARLNRCGRAWAFVTALAFGLAPYQFAQSPHHNTCQYVWYVPLFLPVWRWVSTDPGLEINSRRFWQAMAIGFVTGLQNPYFGNVFCQLALLGGGLLALRKRSWAAALPSMAIVGAVALAFFISNLDTLSYRWIYGPPTESPFVDRAYRWLDIYAFKIVDMFVPWITHRCSEFARFGSQHREASVLLDEEGCVYLGLFGIASLLTLVWAAIRIGAERRESQIPMAAWQVLWIVLMATTGGLNATVAAFTGFTLFRTTCRYGVVILAIVLLYAAERLTGWQEKMRERFPAETSRILVATACLGMCTVILWDQVPRAPTADQQATIAAQVAADREFTANMEAALPKDAMVFQLPVTTAGPVPGVSASDHFRPSLYSTSLRYSVGGNVGRKGGNWQKLWEQAAFTGAALDQQKQRIQLNPRNFEAGVQKLRELGFSGLYVNRNGYPDGGKGIEETLKQLGYTKPPIESPMGDLVCFVLDKE